MKRDSQTSQLTKVTGVVAKPIEHLVFSYKELKVLKEDSKSCQRIYFTATIITRLQFQLPENKAALRSRGHRMVLKEAICIYVLC